MGDSLKGKRVAILAADGVEQSELLEPRKALDDAGAQTLLVSPNEEAVQAFRHLEKGERVEVDVPLDSADPEEFDALMLPGGVANPDRLRMDQNAVDFVRAFVDSGKPVAAICHAPWLLIEAGAAKGRTLTSWPSLKTDLTNAGARWVDQEVVGDGNILTSRKPQDIPAFNRRMIALFAAGGRLAGVLASET